MGAAVSRPLIGVTTSEMRLARHTKPLPEADPPQPEMALGIVYARAVERAGGLPVVLPPLRERGDRAARRPALGRMPVGRPGPRPGGLRRRPASRPRPIEPALDAFELAVARAGRRARHPDPRHLPRLPGAQRRARRHAAPALPDVTDGSVDHRQTASGGDDAHGADRAGIAAGARSRHRRARRELVPPPGGRPARPRPAGSGVGAGRRDGGDRGERAGARTSACSGTPRRWSTARARAPVRGAGRRGGRAAAPSGGRREACAASASSCAPAGAPSATRSSGWARRWRRAGRTAPGCGSTARPGSCTGGWRSSTCPSAAPSPCSTTRWG